MFIPGTTYIDNRPFAAPEQLRLFDCRLVSAAPDGTEFAFGFGAVAFPGNAWRPVVLTAGQWSEPPGWIEYRPQTSGD